MRKKIGFFIVAVMILFGCNISKIEVRQVNSNSREISKEQAEGKKAKSVSNSQSKEKEKCEAADDQGLSLMQAEIKKQNKKLGAAFLGYGSGYDGLELKDSYEKAYPFIKMVDRAHYIEYTGDEYYVIVPPSDKWQLTVHEFSYNEDGVTGQEGKCLYKAKDGKAIVLHCNICDFMANVRVSISKGKEAFNWEPGISLKDGSMQIEPWIYDFSIYKDEYK